MNPAMLFLRYVLALLVFNLAACSTMQAVSVEDAMRQPASANVDIGALVEIRTLDNRRLEFRVTDVTDRGLAGKYGFVAYEDMARLRVERTRESDASAAGILLGILGTVALIALIGSADTVRICSQPPC